MEKYYLTDIESGYKYEVTKEQHEAYMRTWEIFRPKLENTFGQIILCGTAGNIEDGDLKNIFYGK